MGPMAIILETERLRLRTLKLDDDARVFALHSDAEVMRYILPPKEKIEEIQAWLGRKIACQNQHGFTMWAVELKATGEYLGNCGLQHLDETPQVEVGYHFAKKHWGKGYATESARACVKYAFETLGLKIVTGVVNPENVGSQNVLEKAGLTFRRMARYYDSEVKFSDVTKEEFAAQEAGRAVE